LCYVVKKRRLWTVRDTKKRDEKGLIQNKKWIKRENPGISIKKIPPGAWMFVLCLLYKDGSMERKSDMKDEKDLKKIPPGAWMSASCECCVLSGRGLCDELIPRPEESYRLWCVSNV
jgi:hypothetical protein